MRKLPLYALGLGLLITGCKNVPAVTEVPIPRGTTVFNGAYAGKIAESLRIQDAALSADGQSLWVLAQESQHATILELNPSSGIERRRASFPVDDLTHIAWRNDGSLIVAGREKSVQIEAATLQVKRFLRGADRVSQDGEVLLGRDNSSASSPLDIRFSSWTDGDLTRNVSLNLIDGRAELVSHDLVWESDSSGDTLLNLKTGQRIDTSTAHGDPCGVRSRGSKPMLTGLESAPEGVVLAFSDGGIEWRGNNGSLEASQNLNPQCKDIYSFYALIEEIDGSVYYHVRILDGFNPTAFFGTITKEQGSELALTAPSHDIEAAFWFDGTFALKSAVRPLLLKSDPTTLVGPQQWIQSYNGTQFSISASVQATYRNKDTYDLTGTVQSPIGPLTLRGTGTHSAGSDPGIIFTQAYCDGFLTPSCPTTAWSAELLAGTVNIGELQGYALDPNHPGSGRQIQTGVFAVIWNGESRFFTFVLNPQ